MPPPRKKDRPTAVCPRCGNNFRPQGRSAAGSQICRAKAARTRAQKQSRAGGRGLCADCAHGGAADNGRCLVPGRHRTGRPPGQRARPGAKTAPGGSRELCAGCAHGGTTDIVYGVVPGRHRSGRPPGQRVRPGAKQPPAGPEAVWMRDMGVTCPGRSV